MQWESKSGVRIQNSEFRSQNPGVRSQESGVRIQNSEFRSQVPRSQRSESRIQESGVRSQESGIRNQESGIRNQESGIRIRNQESGIRKNSEKACSGFKADHHKPFQDGDQEWILLFVINLFLFSLHNCGRHRPTFGITGAGMTVVVFVNSVNCLPSLDSEYSFFPFHYRLPDFWSFV